MAVKEQNYSGCQLTWLVLLRVAIGWHFLYEGIIKIINPSWTSLAYLMDSKGFMAGFFTTLAENDGVLKIVDFCNEWGLFLIGLGLVLGIFTKLSAYAGILLVSLYYLSHPPFLGIEFAFPTEGNYLIVDKNLVEILALAVTIVFPTGRIIGLDRFFRINK
ncbi:MAG: DoxX family membrane protein [Bacteroidales bacterium]|nr:DoxX family membrane protein [Bacteroidales bacterium]